jgi:hypothetical protein
MLKHARALLGLMIVCPLTGSCSAAQVSEERSAYLSEHPESIQRLLVNFDRCVETPEHVKDLREVAGFLSDFDAVEVPKGWLQTFCQALENQELSYGTFTVTETIDGAPLVIR